jgi:DNA-binding MarR family transcriptional regulator
MSTPAGSPADGARPPFSPTIALLTLTRMVELPVARMLEQHGLTLRKYGVLGHISRSPGLSMSEIARRSGITVQSVHTLIRSLADAGLVRSEVESSGLSASVVSTPAGGALLREIAAEVAALDATLFADDEMRQVSAALAEVIERKRSAAE